VLSVRGRITPVIASVIAAVFAAGAVLLAAPATAGAAVTAPAGHPAAHDQLAADFQAAQRVTRGQGVTVAVLSSGVSAQLPGLEGAVTTGPDYVGFGNSTPELGTLAAAVIAARGPTFSDPIAIQGLAPEAHILGIRVRPDPGEPGADSFYNSYSRSMSAIVDGIRYAVTHGAGVIYLDSQSDGDWTALESAVSFALVKGTVVVAASGIQQGRAVGSNLRLWPASLPGVIAVGTADTDGKWRPQYSLAYPAVSVRGIGIAAGSGGVSGNDADGGQQAATATVAAAATLVKAKFPGLAPGTVEQAIALSARHYQGDGGLGVVNPAGALSEAATLTKVTTTAATGPQALAATDHFGGGPPPTIDAVQHNMLGLAGYAAALLAGIGCLVIALRFRRRAHRP
jgi:hypothetical protein